MVSAHDGLTRSLVVVGGDKARVGASTMYNSAETDQWFLTRSQTKECFPGSKLDQQTVSPANMTLAEASTYVDETSRSFDYALGRPSTAWVQASDRFYTQEAVGGFWVYDAKTGKVVAMDSRVYNLFISHPEQWGNPSSFDVVMPSPGGNQEMYLTTTFVQDATHQFELEGTATASVKVTPTTWEQQADGSWKATKGATFTIDREPQVDANAIDWAKQGTYLAHPGVLCIPQEGADSKYLLMIKANPDGTPVAGATAYRSRWLGFLEGNGLYREFYQWAHVHAEGDVPTPQNLIGAPVVESTVLEENGVKFEVQQFEHGQVKWKIQPDSAARGYLDLGVDIAPIITLDAQTQAVLDQETQRQE